MLPVTTRSIVLCLVTFNSPSETMRNSENFSEMSLSHREVLFLTLPPSCYQRRQRARTLQKF
ncbi:hypothetical protein CVT24_002372, partial [Panaeolus cyanescens]